MPLGGLPDDKICLYRRGNAEIYRNKKTKSSANMEMFVCLPTGALYMTSLIMDSHSPGGGKQEKSCGYNFVWCK